MILYNINEVKVGLKIVQDGEPCIITHSESIKPGKGQSFTRVRFKQIVSGKNLERTFKSGDFLESADFVELGLVYIYSDSRFWYFMDEKNFEETSIDKGIIGANAKWIVTQLKCVVALWNTIPIRVTPPNYVGLKVVSTNTIKKNNSGSSGIKFATVSTGAVVKVPLFIQTGEIIKINTRSGVYVARIK